MQRFLIRMVLDYVIHSASQLVHCVPPPPPHIKSESVGEGLQFLSVMATDSYRCAESLEGTRTFRLGRFQPKAFTHWSVEKL